MGFTKEDFTKVLILFIVWRLFLFSISFVSIVFIPKFGANFPYYKDTLIATGLPNFIWSFGNFDGVHYLRIAKTGYSNQQFTQAFFPLYPALVKIVSPITFGNFLISALLITNTCFLIALFFFYKLIKKYYHKNIAFWSLIFLLCFPTSFYFGAVYTEGIFFMLIILSFYLSSTGKDALSAIAGSFASATKLVGVFMAPALLSKKKFNALFIVPLGLISYMVYLKIKFNDPLYFLTAQSIFGQERLRNGIILPPQVLWRYMKIFATAHGLPLLGAYLEFIFLVLVIILLIAAYKMKLRREWIIFSSLAILSPTLTGTLTSIPRYILVAFPIYIVMASVKKAKIKITLAILFLVTQSILLILFTRGYWVA